MRIIKSQKNILFDKLVEHNLLPGDFEIEETDNSFQVKYSKDYFKFKIIKKKEDDYEIYVFPIDNTKGYAYSGSWKTVIEYYNYWIKQLDVELNTPNKWKNILFNDHSNAFDLSEYYRKIETETFSAADVLSVQDALPFLINEIKKIDNVEEKQNEIIQRLKELPKPEVGLDKMKWMRWFAEKVAGMVIDQLITAENALILMTWLKMNVFVKFLFLR